MRQRAAAAKDDGADAPAAAAAASKENAAAAAAAAASWHGGWLEGFAGTTGGSFYSPPAWVDARKAPGTTSQDASYARNPDWLSLLTGKFLLFSPNLVWLACALLVYCVFPYPYNDIPGTCATFAPRWVGYRAAVNVSAVLLFFGWWHVTLYCLGWGTRPFKDGRAYRLGKVAHNVYYSVLGALQWTAWEAIVLHCYATGRLGYVTDAESFGTRAGQLKFVACCFLVPLWREVHFYFAHRLIHNKVLYKYVHSLHHRNTDVEPFAGLSMHPVEHLFYFSCVGPSLYLHATPFAFLWNGVHLLLSPAASHSGFEDNWQSDQFHYLHHRFFECNYGTPTFPFDRLFGTFRDQLTDKPSATYQGAAGAAVSGTAAAKADAKATLWGLPGWDQAVFNAVTCVLVPLVVGSVALGRAGFGDVARFALPGGLLDGPQTLAAATAFGPVLVGAALLVATARSLRKTGLRKTLLYPFHKEKLLGAYGVNVLVSVLIAVVPAYTLVHTLLAPPGDSHYHALQRLVFGAGK